ncbi:MAG TPA: toprim domain-containing protein [Hyphomicrobium sp.]|mgnify:CR=1 FL=1|nr:toprim domain-containing protein [Hyphomicrobium sp.]HRO48783.1 toprim domain-containing protein [Hyphomicrobium sp.]
MSAKNNSENIKALLCQDMPGLVRALKLEGRRSGTYWLCRSRAHDTKIGGMWVTLTGGMAGIWVDAACGESGDPISLIGYVKFGSTKAYRDAFAWAREFLGLGTMTPEQRERASREAEKRAVAASVEDAQKLKAARKTAKAIYLDAIKPAFLGSPAHRYLASRGIDFGVLGRVPGCLGWLPERRHTDTNTRWPVLLACFTDDAGDVAALHFTFLALDGSGKAPLPPVLNSKGELEDANERNIWPGFKGAAIRLWRGASNRSIADANAWAEKHGEMETLVLCEGVEDGLSSVMSAPDLRTWAVGSLANLGNIKLPPCVDQVMVWRDNDWSKPQAAAQFKRGVAALQAQGARVSIVKSAIGKDANDALRSGASDAHGFAPLAASAPVHQDS